MKIKNLLILILCIIFLTSLGYALETCKVDDISENVNVSTCGVSFEANDSINYQGLENINNTITHDNNEICIVYFYGKGCQHCAATEPFIDSIEEKYKGKISITRYEVYRDLKAYQLYNEYCGIQDIPLNERGIPLVAIGNKFFMGEDQVKDNLEAEINSLLELDERTCPLQGKMDCHLVNYSKEDIDPVNPKLGGKVITLPLVLFTGLIDGINPCAFAVLIFLLTFLLEISSTKKRMIKAGSAYIIAVYITYFLAGFGLLSAMQISGISRFIVKAAAVVAIGAGLINMKDYFWYGKGFSLKIPESKKATIEKYTKKGNIPAAIILGFLVSMFELPCTGGVYLAILAMLASTMTRIQAIGYLLIYNIMFVLPLIIILGAITFGMKAEHIENWRSSKKNLMKLAMGILLLGLGIAMLVGWI